MKGGAGSRRARRTTAASRATRPRADWALPGWLVVLGACAGSPPDERAPDASCAAAAERVGDRAGLSAPLERPVGAFTVRGRWDDPHLAWRCDPDGGPFSRAALDEAARAAAAAWNASGVVALVPAPAGAPADVVVSWHGAEARPDCGPFGRDASAAHTGPLGRPTAVHLDASRPWDLRPGQAGEWLTGALLHELGHALGLGHSRDPDALMFADTHAAAPGPADLAGLFSLYGGGAPGVGDLVVSSDGADAPLVLRGVAPPGTGWSALDVDGDGAAEVLVWSLADDGLGALVLYHLEPGSDGPRLARTTGPLLGALPPTATHRLVVGDDGRRWLDSRFANGTRRLLRFGTDGQLVPATPADAAVVGSAAELARRGIGIGTPGGDGVSVDVDGDRRDETVRRR